VSYEDGLRFELEGYERSGNKDRAKQVKAELDRVAAGPVPPPAVSVTDDPDLAADDVQPKKRAVKAKAK